MASLAKILAGSAISAAASGIVLGYIGTLPKEEREKILRFWETQTKKYELPVAGLEHQKQMLENCLTMVTQNYSDRLEAACAKFHLTIDCRLPENEAKELDDWRDAAEKKCRTTYRLAESVFDTK